MIKPVARLITLALVLFSVVLAACTDVHPKKGLVEKSVEGAKISTKELRMLLDGFMARFSSQVEQAADQIQAQTQDPQIQRNAILWKINAISACYRAALVEDPLMGYVDVVILCRQMEVFFTTGPGAKDFGGAQSIAIETSHDLAQTCLELAATVTSSPELVQRTDTLSLEFAQRDPIQSLHFGRAPPVGWYLERFKPATQGVVEVVGGLADSLADLQHLLVVYSEHLPKEARWQAELLLMELPERGGLMFRLQGFESIDQALERGVKVAEQMPEIVRQERQVVLENLGKQQGEIMDKMERMLRDTLADVAKERQAITTAIQDQSQVFLKQVAIERSLALQESDAISQRRMTDVTQESFRLIDYAFKRGLQLLGLLALVLFSAALFFRRRRAA